MALTPKHLRGIIDTHRSKTRTERSLWDRWRSWYLSEYWRGSSDFPQGSGEILGEVEINFETNYPYAYIDTMIANICPTNPQVTVLAKREELREVAKFREALINDTMSRNDTHRLLWKTATHTAICGRGFLKTVWNFNKNAVEFFSVDPRFFFFDM